MATDLSLALDKLQHGDVVGIPTETVYGLAASIDSEAGLKKIFAVKERPFFDPLIVHVASKNMAQTLTTDWSPMLDFLSEHFWPGPLTLVVPKSAKVNSLITSGLETVGIRMPRSSITLTLIERLGVPVAAPSANKFGRTSPTTAEHVRGEFQNENVLVLDGGPCDVGVESTVLKVNRVDGMYQLAILRAGQIKKTDLEKALRNRPFQYQFIENISRQDSPGHLKHHYMPEIPLVLVKNRAYTSQKIMEKTKQMLHQLPDEVEGVRLKKPAQIQSAKEFLLPDQSSLAARELYSQLRLMAKEPVDFLFFRLLDYHSREEWQAVMDRLTKAASLILD
jgi:L-threonylcarbamoyladenylate synthase